MPHVFSYLSDSLKAGHFGPAIEPRMVDLLCSDLIRVFFRTYPISPNPC